MYFSSPFFKGFNLHLVGKCNLKSLNQITQLFFNIFTDLYVNYFTAQLLLQSLTNMIQMYALTWVLFFALLCLFLSLVWISLSCKC